MTHAVGCGLCATALARRRCIRYLGQHAFQTRRRIRTPDNVDAELVSDGTTPFVVQVPESAVQIFE
ncbi:hypothetical protein PR003_g33718 [Phytophthora rubi]|uniref:Uncharacterized protein n=1 Tax=Phytophthora rubi TaxID=129364 RepID=A0A6A4AVE5_9STRA|nr:hypothetical protein PR003_g33718 [Phytophthora rubi]